MVIYIIVVDKVNIFSIPLPPIKLVEFYKKYLPKYDDVDVLDFQT